MDSNRPMTVCFTGHRPKIIFPENPYNEARRKEIGRAACRERV